MDGATFGAFLQNHREGRNLSLHDLATETKIAERHLAALERGDIRAWPGGIYRRAMVRAYAAAVRLDPDATVSDFMHAFDEGPTEVKPDVSLESSPSSVRDLLADGRSASIGMAAAVCAIAIAFAWATRPSDAGDAIAAMAATRVEAVSTAGHHPDAVPASNTSGVGLASRAAHVDARPTLVPAIEPQPTPSTAPSTLVERALHIVSEPAGAYVTVNGIGWGKTPVTVRHLSPGEKRLRISKDGYATAEQRLALTDDHPTQNVRVTLAVQP